jgi:hypothetical protein
MEIHLHFALFVITDAKPSVEMLDSLLQPFQGEEEEARFDHWAIGGRYSGQVIPYDLANTITGGPDVSTGELEILGTLTRSWNVVLRRPVSEPAAGVDVARFDNIETLKLVPDAILINGEWHRDGYEEIANLEYLKRRSPDLRELAEGMLRCPKIEQRVEAEKVMRSGWNRRWRNILDRQFPTAWLAVVDCHF